MFQTVFFQGWDPIIRTAISTSVSYLILVFLLRFAGQRVLAKWYAFDLIVTVALGSTFANNVLSKDTTIAQALVGFTLLIGLQFVVSWTVIHWSRFRTIVNPNPTLILLNGCFKRDAMRSQRVSEADVRAALRQNGLASVEGVGAVVLEADGTFSIIEKIEGSQSALADIPELGGSTEANRSL